MGRSRNKEKQSKSSAQSVKKPPTVKMRDNDKKTIESLLLEEKVAKIFDF